MRSYPALDLTWPVEPSDDDREIALAALDECRPIATERIAEGVRVFFATQADSASAAARVAETLPRLVVVGCQVPDDDWAERSQAALTPIRVGRIVVTPPWGRARESDDGATTFITIVPSMGFGTGHHASTRLCLGLLQAHLAAGMIVIDIGTGSGVLALAAGRLGAAQVVGVDSDADALANAQENLALNGVSNVSFSLVDVEANEALARPRYDIALANLTAGLLIRLAQRLCDKVKTGGYVIASGYQSDQRPEVERAFAAAGARLIDARVEDTWVGGVYRQEDDLPGEGH